MSGNLPNFREEQSAKIPALTLLTNLGYQFIPPNECVLKRGNLSTVILPDVLRDVLKHKIRVGDTVFGRCRLFF